MAKKATGSGHAKGLAGWRPSTTTAQQGSAKVDWTRTFHVNDGQAFVSGLFALYRDVFDSFSRMRGRRAR